MFGGADYPPAGGTVYFNDLWRYGAGQWTWIGGSNATDQAGAYGTAGTASPSNIPGARTAAAHWVDQSGNFWLFGGYGYDSSGSLGDLNDLWEYTNGEWTWMAGSNFVNSSGYYNVQGLTGPLNIPGARHDAAAGIDSAGNVWLFGGRTGEAFDSDFNELWEFTGGEWAFIGGRNAINQNGIYGTQGVPSANNVPGARYAAVGWTDVAGNLWIFGGYGFDSDGTLGVLNDLWKYNGSEWVWVGGSNIAGASGTYGSLGVAAASNFPGARSFSIGWTDAGGNLWLFGGDGFGATSGSTGRLNDLWKYGAGEWTWVGGSNVFGQGGNYGTQGTASSNNIPGGRNFASGWTDVAGNFWLFGGFGLDSTGTLGNLNDFWKYQP